jgi:membrane-associated protease RseP (regulator of RpoE activity)
MKSRWFEFAALWLAVLVHGPAAGAEGPGEDVLAGLESESYPERVRAQDALEAWAAERGEAGRVWLMKQLDSGDSPEIASRSYEVLKSSVLDELRQRRPGFVGITMMEEALGDENGARFGIRVRAVQPDSPADRVGLQPGDLIVALDGKPWTVEGAQDRFALKVADMGVGAEIRLTVRRGGDERDYDLELGPRPWSAGEYGEARFGRFGFGGRGLPQTEEEAEDEVFETWLKENFERGDDS